jgi:RNA polymerase sigma factor (sigma-70 family)
MKSSAELFTECWHSDGPRVLAYARRHIGDDQAHDVVADTFMVAWRRWDTLPEPPIGWLIATARGVMRNRQRTSNRQRALTDRIARLDRAASHDVSESAVGRQEALARLGALSEQHREALLLTSWDGLNAEEAGEALGIRPAAFRRRLSRARATLAEGPGSAANQPEDPPAARPIQEIS